MMAMTPLKAAHAAPNLHMPSESTMKISQVHGEVIFRKTRESIELTIVELF
jgi:hypothetical protein